MKGEHKEKVGNDDEHDDDDDDYEDGEDDEDDDEDMKDGHKEKVDNPIITSIIVMVTLAMMVMTRITIKKL